MKPQNHPDWHQGHGPNRDPSRDRDIVLVLLTVLGSAFGLLSIVWAIGKAVQP